MRILFLQYTNPGGYPPLIHASQILAERGWTVLFLGTRARSREALSVDPHERIAVRLLRTRQPGLLQKIHYGLFCAWVVLWTLRFRPRWIYASEPLSAPIAALLLVFLRRRVVYHEHDSPVGDSGSALWRAVLSSRRFLGRRAEVCVLPNAGRLARFRAQTGRSGKLFCVWNCPSRREAEAAPRKTERRDLWIYWHGNIGPELLPEALFAALGRSPVVQRVVMRGYDTSADGSHLLRLHQLASRWGLEDRLELLPPVSRMEIWERAAECDLGVALVSRTSRNPNLDDLAGASNKVFDYMAAGLPVLVSDGPGWRDIVVEPGYGLACDPEDPEAVARSIAWFAANRQRAAEMGEAGRQRILESWNYEEQFAAVRDVLEGAA